MEKTKVAILLGGESSEREVSLESGKKVAEHLPSGKYDVIKFDPRDQLQELIDKIKNKEIDVVFPVLHGKYGEDGTIQGLLELLHIPYVGCNVLTSALCMDKIKTKQVISSYGIATPKYETFDSHEDVNFDKIKLPAVVKPSDAGSSVGVTIPETKDELIDSVKQAFKESKKILIEEFIAGDEFTVGVVGPNNKPDILPVTQIEANKGKFYDYKSKYEAGGSTHTCPAKIDKELAETMQGVAKLVYEIMGCEGMSRVDFMVDKAGKHYFIEVNTIPGMTDTSLLPEAAKAAGISFPKLLDNLVQWALRESK